MTTSMIILVGVLHKLLYRIFNKMLKDIREHNHNNSITIDKNLEYRLITKYSTETYDLFKRMLKNYSN